MLRWAIGFLLATIAIGPAISDEALPRHSRPQARAKLPAGLPHAHYKYRTTVTYEAPPPPPQVYVAPPPPQVYVLPDPDVLFTPYLPYVPVVPLVTGRPILPGSSTLPGYYGSEHSYDYQGAYYGGPGTVAYWNRLPYACGVYGYC